MTSPPNGVRARSLSGRALLATLGLWFLLSALGGAGTVFVARSLASAWGFDSNNVTPVIVAEVYAALVFAAVIVLGRRVQTVAALNPAPGRWFVLVFGALGIAYALTAVSHGLLAPFIGAWSNVVALLRAVGSDDGRLATVRPGVAAIIVLRACCLAPLGEELLFRGLLFTWLRQRLSAPLTIAITAVAFSAIHVYPPLLPLTFAIGVAFGWSRDRSDSTAPTILAHVVHNVFMVAFAYVTAGWGAHLPPWGGQ
jgi:CAAX protease family protein